MKVLMTGASGFVGKCIVRTLDSHETEVDLTVLSSKPDGKHKHIIHDRYEVFRETIDKYDVLVLVGGVTPKGKEKEYETDYFENIRSCLNIIRALKEFPKKIIYISSTSVYKEAKKINEKSELNLENMYGFSKIACEKYLNVLCKEHDIKLSILRLGPVYGPGEECYNKIVGTFLRKAINNEDIVIKSNGTEKRNMIYVNDVAKIVVDCILNDIDDDIINIVSPYEIAINDLVDLIKKVSSSTSRVMVQSIVVGREVIFDASQVVKLFGKGMFTSYEDGIKETFEYFKENRIM